MLHGGALAGLYETCDVLLSPTGGSLIIPCSLGNVSSSSSRWIAWYRRSWRDPKKLERVVFCKTGKSNTGHTCIVNNSIPALKILNGHPDHSGIYYCTSFYGASSAVVISNGASLIIGDGSRSNSSAHLLAPSRLPPAPSIIQLTCVVNMNCCSVHISWDVSGTHHKGKMTSHKEPDGTWTFMNFLSLTEDMWVYGDDVTCEVWFSSSPVRLNWSIRERAMKRTAMWCWMMNAVRAMVLILLVFSTYLVWTYCKRKNTST